MKSKPFPEISAGLITQLEQQFPDQAPRSDVGSFGFGKVAGNQEVIDLLRRHFNKQTEETANVRTQDAQTAGYSDPRSRTRSPSSSG